MPTKTQTLKVTGTIVSCESDSQPGRDSGRYGREVYENKLTIRLVTEDGKEINFKTPAAETSVSSSGGYYIALVRQDNWFVKQRWDCEGFAGARGFGNSLVPRVKVGDTVTVEGRVKSNHGKYISLWYVKRLDFSHEAELLAFNKRFNEAIKSAPKETYTNGKEGSYDIPSKGDAPPVPTFPGIAYEVAGYNPGGGTTFYYMGYKRIVIDRAAVVAHVEGLDPKTVFDPQD